MLNVLTIFFSCFTDVVTFSISRFTKTQFNFFEERPFFKEQKFGRDLAPYLKKRGSLTD